MRQKPILLPKALELGVIVLFLDFLSLPFSWIDLWGNALHLRGIAWGLEWCAPSRRTFSVFIAQGYNSALPACGRAGRWQSTLRCF